MDHFPHLEIPNNSSLLLQMALFCNVYIFPVWFASLLCMFYTHYLDINLIYEKVLATIMFCVACPLEIWRLYLGYSGNLLEKVSISRMNKAELVTKLEHYFADSRLRWFSHFLRIYSAANSIIHCLRNSQNKICLFRVLHPIDYFGFDCGRNYFGIQDDKANDTTESAAISYRNAQASGREESVNANWKE